MPILEKRINEAEALCQTTGARLTPIRKTLLGLIYKHPGPFTAYELLRLLREINPSAEAMTVYRTLDFLQTQHLIHRVASQNAYVACDTPQHTHSGQILLCEKCGKTQEINMASIEKNLKQIAKSHQFILSDKPLEVSGICGSCSQYPLKKS